jgi:enamine deaminase RidA (YjgF/YER057c/UK114 family)
LAYRNAEALLSECDATLQNLVEETLFVTDMDVAFGARVKMKNEAYGGNLEVASTLVEISRLAMPPLMVEIWMVARL